MAKSPQPCNILLIFMKINQHKKRISCSKTFSHGACCLAQNHSFKTCCDPEAFTFATISKKCGIKTRVGEEKNNILKTQHIYKCSPIQTQSSHCQKHTRQQVAEKSSDNKHTNLQANTASTTNNAVQTAHSYITFGLFYSTILKSLDSHFSSFLGE